jgi:ribose transport system permease protein
MSVAQVLTTRWVRRAVKLEEIGVSAGLVALVLLIGLTHPKFFAAGNLLSILRTAGFVSIVAYGMVFLMAMGDIDLSVAGIYGLSIMSAAELMSHGMGAWVAAIIAMGLGVAMGVINGALAAVFRIRVLILSIGTLTAYQGLATAISGGMSPGNLPVGSSFFTFLGGRTLGIPAAVWAVVLIGVVLTAVFRRTRFGAKVRAAGSNLAAARTSGIAVERTRLMVLAMIGLLCSVAGMLSLAYFGGADPSVGVGFELQVIAAAIIGGTGVTGGSGTVPGAFLGALVVVVINSGLVFFDVSPNWNDVVTGCVVVGAVGLDALARRRRAAVA